MLPPLEAYEEGEATGACGSGAEPPAGGEAQPGRLQRRIREIALQRMIEATISRVNRALRTRATESGEGRFNIGDVVEIHGPPSTKDAPGWAGPGAIVPVDPA